MNSKEKSASPFEQSLAIFEEAKKKYTHEDELNTIDAAQAVVQAHSSLEYNLSKMEREIRRCEKEINENPKISGNYALRGMWIERMNAYKECAEMIRNTLRLALNPPNKLSSGISLDIIERDTLWVAKMKRYRKIGTYAEIGDFRFHEDCRDFDICANQPAHLTRFYDGYFVYSDQHGFITIKDYYEQHYRPVTIHETEQEKE